MKFFYPYTEDIDSIFDEHNSKVYDTQTEPPYNIKTLQDNQSEENSKEVIIEIACTGLSEENIEVFFDDEGKLTIDGKYPKEQECTYDYKGLSNKDFTRKFKIDKYFKVETVNLKNGLLSIALKEDKPEKKIIPILTDK